MAGVAPAGADRSMVHRIDGEARCRVVVAVAALNTCHRDVRWRLHAGRRRAVVAARAVRVGRGVGKCSARPAHEGRGRADVTGFTIGPVGRHMAGQRCRAKRALRTFARVGTVVARIAPASADRSMTSHAHCVDREIRCRVGVAGAALSSRHRDVRWRLHAGRGRTVMAARTIGIGCGVNECSARPAREGRGRARMTSGAIATADRHVTGERRRTLRTFRSLTYERVIVAGVAAAGTDRAMVHRVCRKACCYIVVAIAALNPRHRDVGRRLHAGRCRAVVAARAVGVGHTVSECSARPAHEGRGRAGVTGFAVGTVGCHMAGQRCGTLRAHRALTRERPVVAGIAPAGADRPVASRTHRVGRKTWRRIGVAITALNPRHRDMRRRGQADSPAAIVAARAVGVGRCVSERRPHPPRHALVAGLTWRGCRNMIRRLAERESTIVTSGASRRNTAVIKPVSDRITGRAAVAAFAWHRSNRVIRRLTDSDRAVVASGTRCVRLDVVDETQIAPCRCQVAAFAQIGRLRMCCRFPLCAGAIMAREALSWRAFETRVDVARCALNDEMRAGECKSGQKVIE